MKNNKTDIFDETCTQISTTNDRFSRYDDMIVNISLIKFGDRATLTAESTGRFQGYRTSLIKNISSTNNVLTVVTRNSTYVYATNLEDFNDNYVSMIEEFDEK